MSEPRRSFLELDRFWHLVWAIVGGLALYWFMLQVQHNRERAVNKAAQEAYEMGVNDAYGKGVRDGVKHTLEKITGEQMP